MKHQFSYQFLSKNTQKSTFMKFRPVGAEMFHVGVRAGGRTDMTKLIVAFRSFRERA
jgi:hypothetical protein